ncbi:MAG: Poly(ADP-ribose) polymerase catalytic domain [Clostridiaceae bacterium]|nr:Poly(ADP-ribose) polymerase catalytic domain [Clostridiaceae bacterium]
MEHDIWFHGTQYGNISKILKNGFKAGFGRFGTGIYFAKQVSLAKSFGNFVITAKISPAEIKQIYYPTLKEMYPDLAIEEEEGVSEIKDYILGLGFRAVEIAYISGETELCVYDSEIIEFCNSEIEELLYG